MAKAGSGLVRAAGAGLLVALATCGNARSGGEGEAGDVLARQEETVRLSAGQPTGAIAVPAGLDRPDGLTFTVSEVRNPGGAAIRIAVNLRERDDTTRSVQVGAVALFPVDQGGTFSLRLPPEARGMLVQPRTKRLRLHITLLAEPQPARNATEPALIVGQFRWIRTAG